MIEDARTISDGENLNSDICIVGGGVAGMSLALALRNRGLRVLLLESGGEEYDPDVQALYEGEIVGRDYYDLDTTRLRLLGGTSNHWGGRCTHLNPIDFEERSWVPDSGWPIDKSSFDPYYEQAHALCQIGPQEFDGDHWAALDDRPGMQQHVASLVSRAAQYSPPTRFGEQYRQDIEDAPDIRALLNATVLDVALDPNADMVSHLRVKTLSGVEFKIEAKQFVLACGAMENARILLSSTGKERDGVGNRNDLVGRYFMEHMSVLSGLFVPKDANSIVPFFENREVGDLAVAGYVALTEETQRREQLLNMCFEMWPAGSVALPEAESVSAIHNILTAIKRGGLRSDTLGKTWSVLKDLDAILDRARRKLRSSSAPDITAKEQEGVLEINVSMEQAPNPDSRVTLSDELDSLGAPRIKLDWRLSEIDLTSYRRGLEILAADLTAAGLGRFHMEEINTPDGWPEHFYGHHHHMGTTRMHQDPRQGVVDANCRVHGLGNLYIAGGSVFPTGGYSWPTVNIVALTLRLADHLKAIRL